MKTNTKPVRSAECGVRNKNSAAYGAGSFFNHGWTRINTDKNAATSGAGSFRTRADVPVFSQIANRKSPIVNRRDVPTISLRTPHSALRTRSAFTLIELLTVIAVIGALAAMGLVVTKGVKKREYLNTATAELNQIDAALTSYQAKYGTYPPSNLSLTPTLNTLYYELSGVNNTTPAALTQNYVTLDGAATITSANYTLAFTAGGASIGGIINCTKGSTEDGSVAQDFLPGLKANRFGLQTGAGISILITSVGGPDTASMNAWTAAGYPGNPFKYVCPGLNNTNSYDLWIDLSISGKTNRISNWNHAPQIL
jgi:prepilin-type N-terminal cleavage/methylation domain-containing protein